MRERDIEEQYLPLVQHLAGSLAARLPRHVPVDDLVSAGLLGLTEAVRAFDPSRGVPFDKYAATRIRGALLDELRNMDWAARSVRTRARAVETCRHDLAVALRRQPTGEEVAASMGVGMAELRRLDADVDRAVVVHYEAATDIDGRDALLPVAPGRPEDVVLENERRDELLEAVGTLPHRHRLVIEGWFLEGRRMEDIARELGVTASRISQLRAEALDLLRDALAGQGPVVLAGRGARRRAAYRRARRAA